MKKKAIESESLPVVSRPTFFFFLPSGLYISKAMLRPIPCEQVKAEGNPAQNRVKLDTLAPQVDSDHRWATSRISRGAHLCDSEGVLNVL